MLQTSEILLAEWLESDPAACLDFVHIPHPTKNGRQKCSDPNESRQDKDND